MHSFLFVFRPHSVVQFAHLVYRNALSVLAVLCTYVTPLCFVSLVHLFIASSHGIPHARILRTRQHCSAVVIECIVVHILQLVSLSETIPGSEVLGIYLNCITVGLDCSWYVLHLQILVTHQCPCCKTSAVELQCLPEVYYGFKVFSHEGVVVSDDATGLRIVFVVVELLKSKIGQLTLAFLNIEYVGVGVHVLETIRVEI